MSGHSKFANIAHKKAANDAAKGKIFTRLGKEIMVAVKEGGPDVNNNSKLRQVVTKCKAANMPNDTIERAIKKAASTDMSNFESVTYEGYGPNGTAIIVEALTDNRNRAASNIRNAFTKGGGNVGTPGCVSFMFDNKGQIIVAKEDCDKDADDLMMIALDAGADDFNEEEDSYEITTAPDDFGTVSDALSNEGITFASAEVTMIPQTMVELTSEDDIKKMRRILALLDEEDDVQNVYHNWDEPIEDEGWTEPGDFTGLKGSQRSIVLSPAKGTFHCGGLRSVSGSVREISRRLPQSDEAKGSPQQSD